MSEEIIGTSATKLPELRINTGNHKPIAISRYRLGKPREELIEQEVQKLLKNQIIQKSSSPWCSPVVIAPKKDGTKRLCIDFRKINEVTIKDAYPLPRIDDILNTLSGSTIFSTLDATSGYHQIPIAIEDIPKTAFQTASGLYEFTRMPFGLSNAPAAFQRTMDDIFREEKGKFLQVYLDDIIIYSKSREEHEKHLNVVLKKIQEANLKLKQKKCKFFQEELEILGFVVNREGIRPTKQRMEEVRNFPVPQTIKELRSFLGLMSYCRDFINNLAALTKPLSDLLKGSPSTTMKIDLTKVQLETFEKLKTLLNDQTKLKLPDFSKTFIVTTDASSQGLSGILAQRENGIDHPISFFSKKITDSQAKYSATQLELLAVVETLDHFKPYLMCSKFILRTDHKALLALKHTKNPDSMLFRWSLFLDEFDYEIEYIKGENNPADILSRLEPKTVTAIMSCQKQIVVENETKRKLIEAYHNELGHASPANMIYHLSKKYEWKGMYTQVHEFTENCITCLRASKAVAHSNFHMIESSGPGDIIVIDTVGPLTTTRNNKKFIITAVDHYTKIAMCRAVPHKSAECVREFLTEDVLPKFAKITTILSDNGLEFKSAITQSVASTHKIKWKFGSPYHPQTQGSVERFNDTILRKLRKISDFGKKSWDIFVKQAETAYNNSFHRVIGCTPNEFFCEKYKIFEIDQGILSPNFKTEISKFKLINSRESIKERYKKEFEGSRTATGDFKIGQSVLKYNFSPQISKIESRWDTGYTIKNIKPGSEAFTLEKNGISYEVNKSQIKKAPTIELSKKEGGNIGD